MTTRTIRRLAMLATLAIAMLLPTTAQASYVGYSSSWTGGSYQKLTCSYGTVLGGCGIGSWIASGSRGTTCYVYTTASEARARGTRNKWTTFYVIRSSSTRYAACRYRSYTSNY